MGSRSQHQRGNNAMVNTLKNLDRIRTNVVEKVFRAVDRGDYVTPDDRYLAYIQQPWRSGYLHLSAPCIYSEVLEALDLRPGQSFLNIGSGTGYLNTLVGLILGCSGINHGVEVHADVVEYANQRLEEFIKNSPALDKFDFCAPKFHCGNGLCLSTAQKPYDRVYCGAECPGEFLSNFKLLIKIGGVLVLPSGNKLLRIQRTTANTWITTSLMNVAFTTLKLPTSEETLNRFTIEWTSPQRLQTLSYAVVRKCMRAAQLSRSPCVYEPLLRCPGITDVDVNELLRLILNMDKNRDCALLLSSGFLNEKQKEVSEEGSDDIESQDSVSKPLQGENKSNLTFKNDVDACPDKTKPSNITQANDGLDKSNSVQTNKSPLSLSIFPNVQKLFNDSEKEKKKSDFTLDSNKELDQLNTSLSNTTIAAPEQPKCYVGPPLKYFRLADASDDKPVNITDTNQDFNNINGVQENGSSISQNLKNPTSDFWKESKISVNNDTFSFGDKEKASDIIDSKKNLNKTNEDQPRTSKPFSFVEELKKKPDKKKEKQGFNFSVPTQNSIQPSMKFSLSGSTPKFPKSNKDSTDDSDGKEQSSMCNIDTSKVFIFSDTKKDPSASPLKTDTQNRATEECLNKSLKETFTASVEKTTSALPNLVTEPVPAVNCTSDDLKDMRLSIVVKKGVVNVQLPYEQKESTNIIFTKMDDKAVIGSDDESSSPNISKTSEVQLAKSQDMYKSAIFQRVKAALAPMPLTKAVPPVVLRISLKTLNYYSAWIWDSMMMTYDELDHEYNKAIFQKGVLLLAEAKVAYAQRTSSHTPNEELRCRETFTDEELSNFKEMASKLPLPLATYLECIGNTNIGDKLITPIIVEHPQNVLLSGAPSLMLSVFKQLRLGVPLNGPLYRRARELGLPMLHWEDVPNTTLGAEQRSSKMRITSESFNFWVATRNSGSVIKWDADDSRTFKKIVLTLDEKKGHNVDFDLSHGMGSQAQLVQTIDYKVDAPTKWFTSVPLDDYSIKLGATFAFQCPVDEQGATIPPPTYMSGQITPRRVMFAILCSVYHS